MILSLNDKYLNNFISDQEVLAMEQHALSAHKSVMEKTGLGNEFLGWVALPMDYNKEEFARIKLAAEKIKKQSDILLVIGIGGSYLGTRAVIQLLKSEFYNDFNENTPKIYFVGNNISPSYLNHILNICEGKDFSVNVISKSGTTTEPALAFKIFRNKLVEKYGEVGAKERIYATTDSEKGVLKGIADKNDYETFVIPDNIGGRFSILTAVGLLPIAVAGININTLMEGAKDAYNRFKDFSLTENEAVKYAVLRNILDRKGKNIEILASYEPDYNYLLEWFKQLYGESEGKDNKGIFPAAVLFSADLHSMGQYIQDGKRNIFETVINVKNHGNDYYIEKDEQNIDGLNFLAGKQMSYINQKAFEGTLIAHTDGGVPNIILELEKTDEISVGYLLYFFEFACALSGYMLGVNPFDQPGVEEYKINMFALLEKSGFEEHREKLLKKLQ